jgi:hypothetical protein
VPKFAKLNFPRYNGSEDPTSWICQAEQFFEYQNTAEEEKVSLAAFHLEGEAQLWYQLFKEGEAALEWEVLKEGLHVRYGPTQFDDFFGDLTKLRQTGTVRDYQSEYERLLSRAGRLSVAQQVGGFISGLKETIRPEVQASRPETLTAAVGLARLYEARLQAQRHPAIFSEVKRTMASSNYPHLPSAHLARNRSPAIKRLSPAELSDRRSKGLCFNCDDKFSSGHKCKKLFLIEGIYEEGEESLEENPSKEQWDEEDTDIPEISLHAISGAQSPQTMRIKGMIMKTCITLLADTGSTHNFLSVELANRLGLKPDRHTEFEVLVANGEKLSSKGKCSAVQVWFQNTRFTIEFYLLNLSGYDAVLGAQWLRTLGPILWDFSKLYMSFQWQGQEVTLKGLASPQDKLLEASKMLKQLRKQQEGVFVQIFSIHLGVEQSCPEIAEPELLQLLEDFKEIFAEPCRLPPPRKHDHQIPLIEDSRAVNVRPYRYPHYQKNEIEKIILGLLKTGVIRASTSPYSSPVLLVKKRDGSWRLSVDYRALNRITVKDKFPIPVIDELLDELHGAQYFSKLDLRSGYHQIRMKEGDVEKTAFRTHYGHFEFLVMPFGLTNAPSTFQSLMNDVFRDVMRKFVLVFFDDILIYSKSWGEHMSHLSIVFDILRTNQLYVKRDKCSFGQVRVNYLGHIINREGVAVDPEKIKAMLEWPRPTTLKALRGFLGLTGYYRKFIQNYGVIARPLTQLLKKDAFKWTTEAEQALLHLKTAMTHAPVLALPDFSKTFVIECDASGYGLGAVLMQDQRPIAFFSQALQGRNLNLSAYEK